MATCYRCGDTSGDVNHKFSYECVSPCRHGYISFISKECDCSIDKNAEKEQED